MGINTKERIWDQFGIYLSCDKGVCSLPERITCSRNLPQDGIVGGITDLNVNKTGHLRNHVKNSLHLPDTLHIPEFKEIIHCPKKGVPGHIF